VFTRRSYTRKRSWLLSWRLSFAGFTGALIGLAMLLTRPCPINHFNVGLIVITLIAFNYKFLIKAKELL
jgi:hypothetical protein